MIREPSLQLTECILQLCRSWLLLLIRTTLNENRKKYGYNCAYLFGSENKCPTIGRYTDEFYPTSTGDNFMLAGIPTVLFEGNNLEDD
jgi:hypothetical protein